jgi:hypothetical protein
MSTVGTLVRDPGIVPLPVAAGAQTILRGHLVSFAPNAPATAASVARIAQATDKVYGVALSDADPDLLYVPIAIKGGYTVSMMPSPGQASLFLRGSLVYRDITSNPGNVTTVATTNNLVGFCVGTGVDSLGNIEVAYLTDGVVA